jgi:hypothetical protein
LPIEQYFLRLRSLIEHCPVASFSDFNDSKQSTYVGFIRGNIYFVDGSILHFREYVDAEMKVERLMYSYHYMNATKTLVFRYDDADHHRELNLPTHPHHKHEGSEENVIASTAPTLAEVLAEIEPMVQLP